MLNKITGLSESVHEFHDMIGDETPYAPRLLTREEYDLRMFLIREELEELEIAHTKKDLVACADGLGDLIYVVVGTAVKMGINIDAVLNEIHRSNMTKRDGRFNARGKWEKGDRYEPPNLKPILGL